MLLEHFVQVHLGDLGAHDIEHIGFDLLDMILKLVVGIRLVAFDHAELHRDEQFHEDVVERLGLDLDQQLLHAQRHALHDALDIGQLEVQARLRGAHIFAEPLDDGAALLLHREIAAQNEREQEERHDKQEHGDEHFHDENPSLKIQPICARWRSAWSASTMAIIASPTGTARMPTQGSWRPLVTMSVLRAVHINGLARIKNGRRRLHGEARDDGLTGRDAAQNSARMIGEEFGLPLAPLRISSAFSSPVSAAARKPSPISTPFTALMLIKAAAISASSLP